MQRFPLTFARFVETAENRSALLAVKDMAACVCSRRHRRKTNPLFLHGSAGTGKTHLVSALASEVARSCPDLVVAVLAAGDLAIPERLSDAAGLSAARSAELVVIEDLQHLPLTAAEDLVQLLDSLLAHEQQVVLTADAGPQRLCHRGKRFPARLTSRLAAGLVVRLEPLRAAGRRALLEDRAQRQQFAVGRDILDWLAAHLPGSARQLVAAVGQVETLARLRKGPVDVPAVAALFRQQAEDAAVTVEQIASRVGGYFQVEPSQLQSRSRFRNVLLPRQVGMYLARRLTSLSLEQIGAYFGGRDHSTVLHACRKVELALDKSPILSGAVRQLQSDLM